MAKTKDGQSHPMKPIVDAWIAKIDISKRVRHEKFGQYAEEATAFFDGNQDWMWADAYARGAGGFLDKEGGVLPTFRITVNKLFEAVAYFGPALYHQNPNVLVTPRRATQIPPEALGINPMDQYGMLEYQQLAMQDQYQAVVRDSCAKVKTQYLDWLQYETDKKTSSRRAIDEAIVAGVGYLETQMYQPPGSEMIMPRSKYLSWVDVFVDPDATYWENVQWIAIRRVEPINLVARRFELDPEDLKGHYQSFGSQVTTRAKKQAKDNRGGESFDLIEHFEVFSKNGFGDLLKEDQPSQKKYDYSVFGDYCYIVAARGVPFPLNCPTSAITEEAAEQLYERVQWPIPFWFDQDGWPISRLTFYTKPNEVWPISLFKPAIGELRFINWCLSFLADKVASSCVTYVGILKSAGATIQKQLSGTMSPFTVVEIAEALGKPIDQIVAFLQAPNFPVDIWKMVSEVLLLIDKRTGLTELMYAMTTNQMRSATEANVKNQNLSIRPDDMGSKVEDFISETTIREMQAARWFCQPEHMQPVVGQLGAILWANYVMTKDPTDVVMQYDYRIEAGSAKKPNKENKVAQLTELAQYTLPVFQQFAASGAVEPFNAYITEMCNALDLDPAPFLVEIPQPEGPTPEEQELQLKAQEMQMEIQLKVKELEIKVQEMQAKLHMEKEMQDQELEHEEKMFKLEMQQKKQETQLKKQESKAKQKATVIAAKKKPAAGAKK